MQHVLTILLLFFAAAGAAADDKPQTPRAEVGQEAPAFSLTGSDGETYTLGDLRGEKDLVLIFFRGTW